MKGNKYWESWTEHDYEIYLRGTTVGFAVGVILGTRLIRDGFIFVKWIKEQVIQKEES